MPARSRAILRQEEGGTSWHSLDPAGTLQSFSFDGLSVGMDDVVGKLRLPDGGLISSFMEKRTVERVPPRLTRLSGPHSWRYRNKQCIEAYSPPTTGYPEPGSLARTNANTLYATTLLARTNPFSPVFSVPVAIKEMVELGSMFNLAAKSFAEFAGGVYLSYRFGWKAFVADLVTLHGIMKELEARIRDYNHLLQHGHTRKRMRLDYYTDRYTTSNYAFHSTGGHFVYGRLDHHISMETWGSVRWSVVGENPIPVDELARFNLAVRNVFDIEALDAPTMYELIPFSWLLDYFSNIGDVLHSQVLQYVVQPSDICIMRHYTHKVVATPTSVPQYCSVTPGFYLRERKTRDVVQMPTAPYRLTVDLLSADRWKVILALIARFKR